MIKRPAIAVLSLALMAPAFAQTDVIELVQMSMYDYRAWAVFPEVEKEPSIVPLVQPQVTWEIATERPGDGTMRVEIDAEGIIPMDPPGATDVKIADLHLGGSGYDIVLDNPYYVKVSPSEGGSSDSVMTLHSVLGEPPVEVLALPLPDYEFVQWVGKAVDLGYVHDPTPEQWSQALEQEKQMKAWYAEWGMPWEFDPLASVLVMDIEGYFGAVPEQCYIQGLFGVPMTPGTDVSVPLPGTPVTLEFDEITSQGHAILTESEFGPAIPVGFRLGDPAVYFDISTTSGYSGLIDVGIDYSDLGFTGPEDMLRLFHYEGQQWFDRTTFVDTLGQRIYGSVSSFSLFAVLEPAVIPAPSAILLAVVGVGLIGCLRRRRTL